MRAGRWWARREAELAREDEEHHGPSSFGPRGAPWTPARRRLLRSLLRGLQDGAVARGHPAFRSQWIEGSWSAGVCPGSTQPCFKRCIPRPRRCGVSTAALGILQAASESLREGL
ncbi:unnamed protein product [Rangifer tarandus platyrhynchus]|uniref:Uncharacterized protein n=1 Tax=Rangifer tarandus platyrhynchus TaxID=3082113 RepID=A0AC59Z794_RANTA